MSRHLLYEFVLCIWIYIHSHSNNIIWHKLNPNFPYLPTWCLNLTSIFAAAWWNFPSEGMPKDCHCIKSLTAELGYFPCFPCKLLLTHTGKKKQQTLVFFSSTKDTHQLPKTSRSFSLILLQLVCHIVLAFGFCSAVSFHTCIYWIPFLLI